MTGAAGAAELSAEELAAVVAAVELVWPRPVAAVQPEPAGAWRFSGRWWSKPHTVQRVRPWIDRR